MIDTVRWKPLDDGGPLPGKVRMIDQTLLPEKLEYLETDELDVIYDAIQRLVVRGAPAIGCAAALGLAAVAQHSKAETSGDFIKETQATADHLATARPTAVNLQWALDRCMAKLRSCPEGDTRDLKLVLQAEAQGIVDEDIAMCKRIGENGVALIPPNARILTHCNAGALATSDYGTALSPIYQAQADGLNPKVYADETRPLLQGARLTAWELHRGGVDVTVNCDNMAGQLMSQGQIDLVIVGTDRIAANGDVANKIGTYSVAVLARYHQIPFYVATPYSTIDMNLPTGADIPIEQRNGDEVSNGFGRRTAPEGVKIHNPAFDVTPAELVTAIITDRKVIRPPFPAAIAKLMA